MGKISSIQWTDATWNIARGCTKVDEDCKYCYMYRDGERFGYDAKQVTRTKSVFNLPLKIKEPSKIFMSSLTDVFHPEIDSYRDEARSIIKKCPQHIFQILTKRPERIPVGWLDGLNNVWIGTSIGSNDSIHRANILARIPAEIRFISFEPLYGEINLQAIEMDKFHWVIIGGESGNNNGKYRYRPCEIEWIGKIILTCRAYKIPVFVKQLGTHLAKEMGLNDRHGGDINEWPEHLRIREFPQ